MEAKGEGSLSFEATLRREFSILTIYSADLCTFNFIFKNRIDLYNIEAQQKGI